LRVGFPLNGLEIDHINGLRNDNRRENLRIVSERENKGNAVRHRAGGIPGVIWDKFSKRWRSRIKIKGKLIYLGRFKTSQEGQEAYQKN